MTRSCSIPHIRVTLSGGLCGVGETASVSKFRNFEAGSSYLHQKSPSSNTDRGQALFHRSATSCTSTAVSPARLGGSQLGAVRHVCAFFGRPTSIARNRRWGARIFRSEERRVGGECRLLSV